MTAINVVALPTVGRSLRLGKGGESVRSGQLLFREEPLLQWSLSDSANDHIDGLDDVIVDPLVRSTVRAFFTLSSAQFDQLRDLVRPPVDCPLESVQRLIEYAHFIAAHYTISKDNLEHFLLVCFTNAHYTPNTHTGSSVAGLFVRASMMNHSCSPNTIFRFTYIQQHGKDSDGNILSNSPCNVEIVFTAVRDLAEGAFLSCSYLNELELLLPTAMRRKRLQAVKFFQCQCERCETEYDSVQCPHCHQPSFSMVEFGPTCKWQCRECEYTDTTLNGPHHAVNRLWIYINMLHQNPSSAANDMDLIDKLEQVEELTSYSHQQHLKTHLLLHLSLFYQRQIVSMPKQMVAVAGVLVKYIYSSFLFFQNLINLLDKLSELECQKLGTVGVVEETCSVWVVLKARWLMMGVPASGLWPMTEWPELSPDLPSTTPSSILNLNNIRNADIQIFYAAIRSGKRLEMGVEQVYLLMGRLLVQSWDAIRVVYKYGLMELDQEDIKVYNALRQQARRKFNELT